MLVLKAVLAHGRRTALALHGDPSCKPAGHTPATLDRAVPGTPLGCAGSWQLAADSSALAAAVAGSCSVQLFRAAARRGARRRLAEGVGRGGAHRRVGARRGRPVATRPTSLARSLCRPFRQAELDCRVPSRPVFLAAAAQCNARAS